MPRRLVQGQPLADAITSAIRRGDLAALERQLGDHDDLATAELVSADGSARSLLHVVTDWPANVPNAAAIVRTLVAAGADVHARFSGGAHCETPLHWAASADDVAALDALLDAGADIEAPGAVIGGGTPLADAVAFGQWRAARRLIERGARASLWQAAALGLSAQVEAALAARPPAAEITNALWCACHGGQRHTAELLVAHGGDLEWIGHDGLTPLGAARRSGAHELVAWLRERGARSPA
ncbi:ankyrin repeat domain-containing protein [Nannocystis pusilla]|uniref:ankyrin repeat domain-containing protein n=1 Tax=Nannocystis pusilla TaxID=889268 RepID=UPI003B7EFE75